MYCRHLSWFCSVVQDSKNLLLFKCKHYLHIFPWLSENNTGDDFENCYRGNLHRYQMWIITEAWYQNLLVLLH